MTRANDKWVKYVGPACDLCNAAAKWAHVLGGLRCGRHAPKVSEREAPKPEAGK